MAKNVLFSNIMLLITIESYPQAMLKTSELNEDNSESEDCG